MKRLLTAIVLTMSTLSVASDIEEPSWELIDTLGDVEVRLYAPGIQAITALPSSASTTEGFKRLAGYIFGGNADGQSIAMTAPVQETLGEDEPVMAFTMPSQYALQDLPAPDDARVQIIEVPARTVATVSFSGWATGGKVSRMQRKLLAALEQHAIEPIGEPILNQYNPPWTLPFLRRNEVSVEVRWNPELASAR